MFIPYIKTTGEIVTPIIGGDVPQDFNTVFGTNATIYTNIYDSINLANDNDVVMNPNNYIVDVTTKELMKKAQENKYPIAP